MKGEDGTKESSSTSLQAITLMRKLTNHPDLLDLATEIPGCQSLFPEGYVGRVPPKGGRVRHEARLDVTLSGKMMVLDR
jgi:DNA repair and recombination RAD54-like protein